jgi:decaprenylphospho-beta-D-ribofuranose 2-oxidase
MAGSAPRPLALAGRRVFDGFGFAVRGVFPFVRPTTADEVAEIYARATAEGLTVGMRGNGRSYGDAAINGGGVILDTMGMDKVLSLDPASGIVEVEPGVTIEGLWRRVLAEGWWPAVVPGTMFATLGGCAAMNVHGKNHFKVGGTGDVLLDADLLTPGGERLLLSRDSNTDVFHAAVAGFGMLGTFTRLRFQLKKIDSGLLRVRQIPARSFEEQFEVFEREIPGSDYLVSWVDCVGGGASLGRGQIHSATYVHEDPNPRRTLEPAGQDLPKHIMGVPRTLVSPILAAFQNAFWMRWVNRE